MLFSYSRKNSLAVFFSSEVLFVAIAALLALSYPQVCMAGPGDGLSFEAPAFVTSAIPGSEFDVSGFPQNEAGICAYANYGPIDIEEAKGHFRDKQNVGDTYVMGTMLLHNGTPNFGDISYPHFYVNDSGWVIAFIPHDEPDGYAINTWVEFGTSLELAIKYFCGQMNIAFVKDDLKYYNFEYPDAMGMVLGSMTGSGTFFVTIPESIDVLSLSWASTYTARYHRIDGIPLTSAPYSQEDTSLYGEISLTKGEKHEIYGNQVFGIIVIYR